VLPFDSEQASKRIISITASAEDDSYRGRAAGIVDLASNQKPAVNRDQHAAS
jgi:hypothetical protein